MTRQTDLFASAVSTAELLPFPLARRIGHVRGLANELEQLPSEKWQRRYNHRSRMIAADLRDYGFSEAEIAAELCSFAEAVNLELDQRAARQSIG